MIEQRARLFAIDPPVQQRNILRLAGKHVNQVEAREVGVLQLGELVAEHHGPRRAVAVEQREFAFGLRGKRGADDRQQRRDAAAGGEADVLARARRIGRDAEMAERRHHIEAIAGGQRFAGPGREHPAGALLDGDAQRAVLHRRAYRVRATDVLPVDGRAHGDVLARFEAERRRELGGHRERERHGVARLALDRCERQRMELAHRGLK